MAVRVFALGRECELQIEGQVYTSASDVFVRESVTEVDATGFNHQCVSSVVTQRTVEITVSIPDLVQARMLGSLRWRLFNGYKLPIVVSVSLSGGLVQFSNYKFTVHDMDADEPLDGIVIPRFVLKQWGH